MKISYNWLKDYLKIDINPAELSGILTGLGLEVEGVEEWESVKGGLEGVITGKVLTCTKHPDADRLSVTTVDIGGKEPLQIVCGAPNVAAGQIVPVAQVGATVWKGDESLEIRRSKIRGVESQGMICAEDELGIGDSHDGIMVLPADTPVGTTGAAWFKVVRDTIFEIGLTPNRIDSGSHYGVARDLAAFLSLSKKVTADLPDTSAFNEGNKKGECGIIIENNDDCRRYSGLTIRGVKVGESPEWLKNRLRAVGQTPINNVVDITNYVLLEIGQPLHAFDADKINGGNIIVKNLPEGTEFTTLDKEKRKLSASDLMICDTKGGLCIAGVFGGSESGVTPATTNVFLESAWFNPVVVRKTARRHMLNTNASFRFERGADPEITVWALKRAALLIAEVAGGTISGITDLYPNPFERRVVEVSFKNIERLIGYKISNDTIKAILNSLEIKILSEKGDSMSLEIPSYRVDVTREADIIEEILRIFGFNSIPIDGKVNSTLTYIQKPDREKLMQHVSDLLTANGFTEIMNNSLTPSSWYAEVEGIDPESVVSLANPLSNDLNTMRRTLLFGGLSSISWNINRQSTNLRFYEFGTCYSRKKKGGDFPVVNDFFEEQRLALFITGEHSAELWNNKSRASDFFQLRSYVELILSKMGIDLQTLKVTDTVSSWFAGGLTFVVNGKVVCECGLVSNKYLKRFEIDQKVFFADLSWEALLSLNASSSVKYSELPKYPWVRRDLALLVDSNIKFEELKRIALKVEKNILKEVSLFDVYESDSLGKNKKSYALSFILQDKRQTLTDKGIEKVMKDLTAAFTKEAGATIR